MISCITILFVALIVAVANAHSVSFCYDLISKPGTLIIYEEHWHGKITTSPYGILFKDSTNPRVDFSKWKLTPHGYLWDKSIQQLKQILPANAVCLRCPGQSNQNTWFTYEFPVCIFGAQATAFTVYGDPSIVITEPSTGANSCSLRISIPQTHCLDTNNDGLCESCNCVSCSGTPFDSVCGNGVKNTNEECDDKSDPTNCNDCKCKAGWTSSSGPVCKIDDPCLIHGFNGNQGNPATATCTNSGSNRVIKCSQHYYIKNTNYATQNSYGSGDTFPGCLPINECARYGYAPGGSANTNGCIDGTNSRTIKCATGNSIKNQQGTFQVVLSGAAGFVGCEDTDECGLYGCKPSCNNFWKCENKFNSRTVYCKAGYFVVGKTQDSTTLTAAADFQGCQDLDECAVYGFNSKTANTKSCVQGLNERTLTCSDGFYVDGQAHDSRSVVITGNGVFGGCEDSNECTLYGDSGRDAFTASCSHGTNNRVITCQPGYYAQAPTNPNSKTLVGSEEFMGCKEIDECVAYGPQKPYSGGIKECADKVNSREVTCMDGFMIKQSAINLRVVQTMKLVVGAGTFPGCDDVNECEVYGSFPNPTNVAKCVNSGINKRTIVCEAGYAVTGTNNVNSIELTGSTPFTGCYDINECEVYGYGDKQSKAETCENLINKRTITCEVGYFATPPADRKVTLIGSDPFNGCADIDECEVYGFSGNALNAQLCRQSVNGRRVTCDSGFAAVLPSKRDIFLEGSTEFSGCTDIDECHVYGFSGNDNFTSSCVQTKNTPDSRTITCNTGYSVPDVQSSEISLVSNETFDGCSRWCGDGILVKDEGCDDSNVLAGDGCNEDCQIEDGFICPAKGSRSFGTMCCPKLPQNFYDAGYDKKLECHNNWWITNDDEPFVISTPKTRKRENTQIPAFEFNDDSFRFCGHLVFGDNNIDNRPDNVRERQITSWVLADIQVAGAVTIEPSGTLYFETAGHFNISGICRLPVGTVVPNFEYQFAQNDGTIGYWGIEWSDNDTTTPTKVIDAEGCVNVEGSFFLNATTFKSGANSFTLIHSSTGCVVNDNEENTYHTLDHYLPNHGCSNLDGDHDEDNVYITINKRDLCPAEMAGIGLAIIFGSILAVVAIAYFAGLIGGSSEATYVAL